ncbi:hypothetical protein BB561_005040 [Smittium simulii]|uniref:Uncharacterized protein n=1 Tax=Smittium simulii TaxID=133385 RepID=A0A2T9YCM6_9FUNG|nr:hypothetical protein BB561_005040 [Smittium simulii]
MRFSIISYSVYTYFFIFVSSAPIQTSEYKINNNLCKNFLDYFKTGFRCDLTGAFLSPDENNHNRHPNTEIIATNNALPGNVIPEKDINFKGLLEANNENHFPGGIDDIIPAEQDEIPVPVAEFNNGVNNPAPPNIAADVNNELPDFDALLPQEGANVAGSLSAAEEGLAIAGSIIP